MWWLYQDSALFLNVCLVLSIFFQFLVPNKLLVDSIYVHKRIPSLSLTSNARTYHKKKIIRPVILLIHSAAFNELVVSGDTLNPFSLGAVVSTIANFFLFKGPRLSVLVVSYFRVLFEKFHYRVNDGTTPRGAFQSSRESTWWCTIFDDMKWHFLRNDHLEHEFAPNASVAREIRLDCRKS